MAKNDLHAKLRRLGVVKGARHLKPAPPAQKPPSVEAAPAEAPRVDRPLAELFPAGRLVETAQGSCFVVDQVYPLNHIHGRYPLGEIWGEPLSGLAELSATPELADASLGDLVFIDTETSGLGGAGTLAFMVGAAFFENEALVVRQYFLRDHGDEGAMLLLLGELVERFAGLVTFNGRSFDLPLLDNRYLMNRLDLLTGELVTRPHFDLLLPARRLWRRRFDSCSLGSLETNLLGIRRTQADVPGWLIPALYRQWLLEGTTHELPRIFYHNQIDMLSMVTLLTHLAKLSHQPQQAEHPLELLGMARWFVKQKNMQVAETLLVYAVEHPELSDCHFEVRYELALLLKKNDRREEAVGHWHMLAVSSVGEIDAHVELAKHYEWYATDFQLACHYTEDAIQVVQTYQPWNRLVLEELEHRLARIRRKLENR